jgi:hypothetical protein
MTMYSNSCYLSLIIVVIHIIVHVAVSSCNVTKVPIIINIINVIAYVVNILTVNTIP